MLPQDIRYRHAWSYQLMLLANHRKFAVLVRFSYQDIRNYSRKNLLSLLSYNRPPYAALSLPHSIHSGSKHVLDKANKLRPTMTSFISSSSSRRNRGKVEKKSTPSCLPQYISADTIASALYCYFVRTQTSSDHKFIQKITFDLKRFHVINAIWLYFFFYLPHSPYFLYSHFLPLFLHSEYAGRREIDTSFRYPLLKYGWNPKKKNVIVIHGFNGTESKSPMTIIRDGTCPRPFSWVPMYSI